MGKIGKKLGKNKGKPHPGHMWHHQDWKVPEITIINSLLLLIMAREKAGSCHNHQVNATLFEDKCTHKNTTAEISRFQPVWKEIYSYYPSLSLHFLRQIRSSTAASGDCAQWEMRELPWPSAGSWSEIIDSDRNPGCLESTGWKRSNDLEAFIIYYMMILLYINVYYIIN